MYVVTKRINGHDYLYEQRTYRVGENVKTVSRYLMPADKNAPRVGNKINTTQQAVADILDFIYLGPLPVGAIQRIFKKRIKAGAIGFYMKGQEHAIDRHSDDYGAVYEAIKIGTASPVYIGRSPKHQNTIELYYQHNGIYYLSAIPLTMDRNGVYKMVTIYEFPEARIKSRFSSGRLHKLW